MIQSQKLSTETGYKLLELTQKLIDAEIMSPYWASQIKTINRELNEQLDWIGTMKALLDTTEIKLHVSDSALEGVAKAVNLYTVKLEKANAKD